MASNSIRTSAEPETVFDVLDDASRTRVGLSALEECAVSIRPGRRLVPDSTMRSGPPPVSCTTPRR